MPRRSHSTRSSTSWSVCLGELAGRQDRSTRPASPPCSQRAYHLANVCRATPASAATWQIGRPESTRSQSRRRPSGVSGALGWATRVSLVLVRMLGRFTPHQEALT